MSLLGQQYSGDFSGSPAWWASLNAVLAIAQRRRHEREPSQSSDLAAWDYAANAMSAVLDILMRNTQLISVQALLSVAWFFIGTPNPQPTFLLIAGALRLAHTIGLHKSDHHFPRGSVEHTTRTKVIDYHRYARFLSASSDTLIKVFWIAISLDRELCLRTGRPPVQDFRDSQVGFPQDMIDEDFEMTPVINGLELNIFKANSQLAHVQNNTYFELYSTQALTKESTTRAESIEALDQQLRKWCTAMAPAFEPGRLPCKGQHPGLIRLHYSYNHCVVAIHRARCREYWMPLTHPTPPTLSTSDSGSIRRCVEAARSVATMIHLIPYKWKSFWW